MGYTNVSIHDISCLNIFLNSDLLLALEAFLFTEVSPVEVARKGLPASRSFLTFL
jgi:hypothetical protein